jgi:hypothetical protein
VYESFQDLLLKQPGVYRVNCTRRTNDISTNKNNYQDLIQWIDEKITSFFATFQTSGVFNDFPKPCRLGRHRQTRTNEKAPTSSYAQTLRKRFRTSSESGSIAPVQKPNRPA